MSQEHSAEWLRGRLQTMLEQQWVFSPDTITMARQNLAAAEAREAGKLSKAKWIERYGGQAVLDREGMDVVPCVDCDDSICHGWRVTRKTEEASEAGKVDNQRVKLESQEECLRNAALFLRMTGFKNAETFSDLLESEADKVLAELEQLRPTNPTQPTAAEVIAGAKKALGSWGDAMDAHGEWDDGCFYYAGTSASELQPRIESTVEIMKAIAAWEAAQR